MEWNKDNLIKKIGYNKGINNSNFELIVEAWNLLEKEIQISNIINNTTKKEVRLILDQDLIDKLEIINKKIPDRYKTWNNYSTKNYNIYVENKQEAEKRISIEKRREEYLKQNVEKQKKKKENIISCGVYGIYQNNELIYIGMTMRNFEDRWSEHLKNIKEKNKKLYFEQFIDIEKDIQFKRLIDICQLKTNKEITRRDIESMELALISLYKPIGNLADGKRYEYKYS